MTLFRNKYRIESARLKNWNYANAGAYFITICTKNREHFFGEIINDVMQLSETGKQAEKYWLEIPNHFENVRLGEFVIMPNHIHGILILDNKSAIGIVDTLQCNVSENDKTDNEALPNDGIVETLHRNVSQYDGTDNEALPNDGIVETLHGNASQYDGTDNEALPNDGIVDTLHGNVSQYDGMDNETLPNDGMENNTLHCNVLKNDNTKNKTLQCNVSTDTNEFMSNISPKPGSVSTIIRSYKSVCTKNIHLQNTTLDFAWQQRFHDHIIRNHEEYIRIENYIMNNPKNWQSDKFYQP